MSVLVLVLNSLVLVLEVK